MMSTAVVLAMGLGPAYVYTTGVFNHGCIFTWLCAEQYVCSLSLECVHAQVFVAGLSYPISGVHFSLSVEHLCVAVS